MRLPGITVCLLVFAIPTSSLWSQPPGKQRFKVPAGFRVEEAVRIPENDKNFSLVNMCFDNQGRLLVAREGGPIFLCTEADSQGVLQKVEPYCTQVKNCHGMCWVDDALLLVGNGPQGTGLYRARVSSAGVPVAQVELLHAFQGGIGEHGPHAIIHGPDNWLYLVIGNHAAAKVEKGNLAPNSPLTRWPTGRMGPDQGKPGTTEDVLLPRLNDANGHAANILAPGGTIWRVDQHGKNMSLVAAGFRNHFDAAFSPAGELFTFDSDMEWDVGLPWYRHVRICHCPPGADFVWRTGAANTPNYYLDSLPPLHETGRGSPVGLEFYDHVQFPGKYRGAFFMADWSIGTIWAVPMQRQGATYRGDVEKFCLGTPMNATDCAVAPDGSLYFTVGGRGTQGGVFRIVYGTPEKSPAPASPLLELLTIPQPLAAWSRHRQQAILNAHPKLLAELAAVAVSDQPLSHRLRALDLLFRHGKDRDGKLLARLLTDKNPAIVSQAVLWTGLVATPQRQEMLTKLLGHEDALVRRRACEALIRAGIEPPVAAVWPLLSDADPFIRHAARLVLERIEPTKWVDRLVSDKTDLAAWNAIVALAHTNQAAAHAEPIYARLQKPAGRSTPSWAFRAHAEPLSARLQKATGTEPQALLDWLRTMQLTLIHTNSRPSEVKMLATQCFNLFPQQDSRVNKELAIVLAHLQREGHLKQPWQAKVVPLLQDAKGEREQQIHYFYCLRVLKEGWTPAERQALTEWYERTRTWTGGNSFTGFLANIFKECLDAYPAEERTALLRRAAQTPWAARTVLLRMQAEDNPQVLPELLKIHQSLPTADNGSRLPEFRQTLEETIGRLVVKQPSSAGWPFLVSGLRSQNPVLRSQSLTALRKLDTVKPKAEDATAFRAVLEILPRPGNPKEKWQAILLVRQWSGRSFGADAGQWEDEGRLWTRWFSQTFPKEKPLAGGLDHKPGESKYSMAELLTYLEKDPQGRKADPARGRLVFEKALCHKCHKLGTIGDSVGPDLTALAKRFKRQDILEAILFPSKVISDQYRSTTITTKGGQSVTGLASVQGDAVTILLSDASKVTLSKKDIESQVASLISVMPERLLDNLSRAEIADLLAFLESSAP